MGSPDHIRDEMSLRDLANVMVQYRITILVAVVIFTGFAVAASVWMTPIYRASVLIAPVESKDPLGALGSVASQFAGLAGVGLGGSDRLKQDALAIMQSRALAEKFITERELLPKLFPDRWDESKQQWKVKQEKIPSLAQGFKVFDRKVRSVTEDQLTGLITLSMEHRDREVVAAWANALVAEVNAYVRRRAIEEAERSLRYLNEELARTDVVELRLGMNKLIEQQLKDIMIANVRHEYVFRVIDPAVTPERKNFVRPRRFLMTVGGVIVGLLVGAFAALLRHAFSDDRRGAQGG